MIKTESIGHNSGQVDDDKFVSLIQRIEAIQLDIDDKNADKSECFKEARSDGYDVPAMRIVLKERADERKGNTAKIEATDGVADVYRAALARKGA